MPSEISSFRDLFSKLGARNFLEPKTLAISAVPLMSIASLMASQSSSLSELSIWISANLLVFVLLAGLALGIRRILYSKNPLFVLPSIWTIPIAAGLGLVKGLFMVFWLELSDPTLISRGEAIQAIVINVVLGPPVILTASALAAMWEELRENRRATLLAENLLALKNGSKKTQEKLAQIRSELESILEGVLDTPEEKLPLSKLDQIRNLTENKIRPLARSLFIEKNENLSALGLRAISRKALNNNPNPLVPALVLLFFLGESLLWPSFLVGLLFPILAGIATFVIIFTANMLTEKLKLAGPGSYVIKAAVLPTVASLLILLALSAGEIYDPMLAVFLPLWLFQVSFLASFISEILGARSESKITDQRISESDSLRETKLLRRQRKELANQLHGSVQAKLLRISLARGSNKKLTKDRLIDELQEVIELLEESDASQRNVEVQLEELVNAWRGFIEVEINLTRDFLDSFGTSSLVDLVQELVLNAYRHGQATRIAISNQASSLIATDNGSAEIIDKQGMGSGLFEAHSNSWRINKNKQGETVVTLSMAERDYAGFSLVFD